MPKVEVHRVVSSPLSQAWKIVSDLKAYPQFMPSVKSIEVLENHFPQTTKTRWSVLLRESVMEWTEIDHYDPENGMIEFSQTEGDLEMFHGKWRLQEVPHGTEIKLQIEFKIGIPSMEDLLTPIAMSVLEENCRSMLDSIDSRVNSSRKSL